jgi:hypothetical protein
MPTWNNSRAGNLDPISQSCDGRKLHETYRPDWRRAVRIDACTDQFRFSQAGDRAACRAGRRRYSCARRAWPRPHASRRPGPPLWMGPGPRAPLRLAPSSLLLIRGSCGKLLSSSHCPGEGGRLQMDGRADPARPVRQVDISRGPSRLRSVSGRSGSWRRASA